MNVLILGAAGGTGRELVTQALEHGHVVTALVREPARVDIDHPNLRVVRGDVTHATTVERVVEGQDAVLCALGAPTPLKRDRDLTDGVRNVVHAMERAGTKRFVYLSFLGVHEARAQLPFLGRYITPIVLHNPVADHEDKESLVKQSQLDWTIVRPPKLTNGRPSGAYRCGEQLEPNSVFPTIARADVAEFMVRQLTDRTFVHKATAVMH